MTTAGGSPETGATEMNWFSADAVVAFPDPLTDLSDISGATFLYFTDRLVIGAPASLIPDVAERASASLDYFFDKSPAWIQDFENVLALKSIQSKATASVLEELRPIKDSFQCVYFSYPADTETMALSMDGIESSFSDAGAAFSSIDPRTGASDLVRHIYLEMGTVLDWNTEKLYNYCDELFTEHSIEKLLASAYLLRLNALASVRVTSLLLVNPKAAAFLAAPQIQEQPQISLRGYQDVAAWELFRRLISPYLDPLTDSKIRTIATIRQRRLEELEALKRRCRVVAEDLVTRLGAPPDEDALVRTVRDRLLPEAEAILKLDRQSLTTFRDELLSDKATWAGLATFLSGLLAGSPILTGGATVAALSSVGAAAYKANRETKLELDASDLALIYHINRGG